MSGPEATRDAFGRRLAEVGSLRPEVVVLDGDLAESTRTHAFARLHPDRFFNLGCTESHTLGVAAGMASGGVVPVVASFAIFLTGRAETIRMSIAYNGANVKIVGTHAGLGVGEDGYSQQGLEDVALVRSFSNFAVVQPCDGAETERALDAALDRDGPVYLRLTRQKVPAVTRPDHGFELGRGVPLRDGSDVTLFASGGVVAGALEAARILETAGVSAGVVNLHTIQPIDRELIAERAERTPLLVSVEDHSVTGGLGSAIAEVLCETRPRRLVRIGTRTYGESGPWEDLYRKHGLDAEGIAGTVTAALA